jgi:5'-methylthioadenosine phosphorylase
MGILGQQHNQITAIGIIIGSNKLSDDWLTTFEELKVDTDFGVVSLLADKSKGIFIIMRHGQEANIPPHKINHRANIKALKEMKVEKILSFTSVGTLQLDLRPGTMIMPKDYINIFKVKTFFDSEIKHIIPGLDNEFRRQIFSELKSLPISIKFNGVYIQTHGPRLETRAEIQMFKNYGDVVGMTMATEATLAKEIGIGYANISVIDNYCHGLMAKPISMASIKENQFKNSKNINMILQKLLEL